MKRQWTLADLLDLEFFLSQDQELSGRARDRELAERDRLIYQTGKAACESHSSPKENKKCLLRVWVSRRREVYLQGEGGKKFLPGRLFQELIRASGWGLFILALLVGWGLAMTFLSYSGTTPVNVAVFLALFVGSQLCILGIQLTLLAFSRLTNHSSFPVTYSILHKTVFRLSLKLDRFSSSSDIQRWLVTFWGRLNGQKKKYSILLALPFFCIMQLAGAGFNIGVLTATLLKVLATDIAFGWQSTLQVGSEAVYHLVQLVALPWSWLVPVHLAHPTLAQISGSQMVLKDGIYHLATEDLVSWWPFLCCAVLIYGLLPRVVLLLAACWRERILLAGVRLNTAAQQQLLLRMGTPRVSTESKPALRTTTTAEVVPGPEEKNTQTPQTAPPEQPIADTPEHIPAPEPKPVIDVCAPEVQKTVLALIPDELYEECSAQELSARVAAKLGLNITETIRIDQEEEPELLLSALKKHQGTVDSILLLQEAWQPPIEDYFYLLGQLRTQLEPESLLTIVLIGKPRSGTIFTPVKDQDYIIWQQKIQAQGDPYLQCIELVSP